MANHANTTRRNLLKSIPACGLAAIVPTYAVSAATADPLADAICEYREKVAEFNAIPIEQITMENEGELIERTYGPLSNILYGATPEATSSRGVAEAIRYALDDGEMCSGAAVKVLESALAFLSN